MQCVPHPLNTDTPASCLSRHAVQYDKEQEYKGCQEKVMLITSCFVSKVGCERGACAPANICNSICVKVICMTLRFA